MQTEAFLKFYTALADDKASAHQVSNQLSPAAAATSVFRIDKFIVPVDALSAFIEKMRHIQQILRALPGCHLALTLKQTGGSGEFNVVTFVEWNSAQAVSAATTVMQKHFAEEGFDPASFAQRLGVRGDMGFYGIS